tara:strand:- start:856 stop:1035 length:180 start_codon:yes stop_codon:yes gene_type:complete
MMKKQLQELIEKMNADWERERNELKSENKALLEKVNELKKILFTFEKICRKTRTREDDK